MSQWSSRRRRQQPPQNNLPPLSIVATRVSTSPHRRSQPQDPSNDANINRTTAATTVATVQQQQSLLLTLSESCKRHAATAHGGNSNRQLCTKTLAEAPSYCQESVDKLVRIIPKVEEKCGKQDVVHMCDFYRDCLAGGFCPHAPHLFLSIPSSTLEGDFLHDCCCLVYALISLFYLLALLQFCPVSAFYFDT